MGLNFRKSLSIGKLFRINFSKKGLGVSTGVKGARTSVNREGVRESVSLPGTGLSWSERQSFRKNRNAASSLGNTGDPVSKQIAGKQGKKFDWKPLIWVGFVMGGFLLLRSGALDNTFDKVKQALGGTGTILSANDANSPEKQADKAFDSAQAPDDNKAAGSLQTPAAKDAGDAAMVNPELLSSGDALETGVAQGIASSDSRVTEPVTGNANDVVVVLKDGTVVLSSGTRYVASTSGQKFHKPDCRVLRSIMKKNLTEYAMREAAAEGKEPCLVCNP